MPGERDVVDWLHAVVDDVTKGTTDPLLVHEGIEKSCYPHKLRLNVEQRTVSCDGCGKEFTHWDAVLYLSKAWGRYAANLDALKRDIARLTEHREQARKRVQSLKAQAKRAAGSVAVAEASVRLRLPRKKP